MLDPYAQAKIVVNVRGDRQTIELETRRAADVLWRTRLPILELGRPEIDTEKDKTASFIVKVVSSPFSASRLCAP